VSPQQKTPANYRSDKIPSIWLSGVYWSLSAGLPGGEAAIVAFYTGDEARLAVKPKKIATTHKIIVATASLHAPRK
jgi:hypothetical protein